MEGERERLNRRISALTEQLTDVKFTNGVETFNVREVFLFLFFFFNLSRKCLFELGQEPRGKN